MWRASPLPGEPPNRGYRPGMPVVTRLRRRLRPVVHRARRMRRRPRWGNLRRREPFDDNQGYARGTPVDRHYIEAFLAEHAQCVRGDVLEVVDSLYTRLFAAPGAISHVVDLDPGNRAATIVGDLAAADVLPAGAFDCVILTQTLQYLPAPAAGLRRVWAALRPGGTLLLSAPSISSVDQHSRGELWRFTPDGLARLLADVLPPEAERAVVGRGNLVAATAFVHGLAREDLRRRDLARDDPRFPVVVLAKVGKPPG